MTKFAQSGPREGANARATSPSKGSALLFFIAMFLSYASLSPFRISDMGYAGEEMKACRQILWGAAGDVEWPRNGAVSLLFQCPLMAVSHAVAGTSTTAEDAWLALQPILATSALLTLLFIWCSRLASSRAWGFALALATGLGTMIWPYAYIGLETTQSLFLLLAAFIAIGSAKPLTWRQTLLFALCAAVAVTAKSGGFLLAPAIAYLGWDALLSRKAPGRYAKAAAAIVVIGTIFAVNNHYRALSWVRFGGARHFASGWFVREPVAPFLSAVSLLGSPNKGLIVFAPLALLGLFSLPRAFERDRKVAIFAFLTLAGLLAGLSILEMWSDETWGPRYLHSAIAPLVLCFAVSRRDRPLRVRTELPFGVATAVGLVVSLLGSLFYYGMLGGIAAQVTPITLEALQGSPTWNHVRFNARLLQVWTKTARGRAGSPELLKPERSWDYSNPNPGLIWKPLDLRPWARPQPFLLAMIGVEGPSKPEERIPRALCLGSGVAGIVLLGTLWRRERRST